MNSNIKKRLGLTLSLVFFIFAVMVAAMLLAGLVFMILHLTGMPIFGGGGRSDAVGGGPLGGILAMMVFSALLGTALAGLFSKKALDPIRKIIDATQKVADGDFDIRLDIKGIYELEELSQSFNKMAHELATIETLRSDFVNSFSHEFKTPIGSIRGFAKLLKDDDLQAGDRREYLDIIIAETDRLSALSTNVLNLTKYENLEIVADVTTFRLDEQLRRAVNQMESRWRKKDISVDMAADDVMFTGNADLTQQMLLNLIDNAIKFSNPGGSIVIRLSYCDNGIRLTIKDDGIGMDIKTQSRIFDKFYQGDPSRSKAGNGLGLSIVKRIVDLCGGSIEVRGELGVGSEFTVWLPLE